MSWDEGEAPEGWSVRRLGQVASLVAGAGFPLAQQNQSDKELPFFKVGNLGEVESGQPLRKSSHTISASDAKKLGAKIIPAGATVFAKIGMAIKLNRRRQLAHPSCIDNNMMAAIPRANTIDARYLLRFLETVDLMDLAHATTVPAVRKSELEQVAVPVPPLAEQSEIAATIDKIFARRSSNAAHLNAALLAIERFRRAVLAAACSGRLTANWRDQSSDAATSMAEVLIEMTAAQKNRRLRRGVKPDAKIDEAIEALDLPSSWTVASVSALLASGALVDVKDGNHGANHPKASEFSESGLPFITANVVKNGLIDYGAAPKVSGEALARLRVGFAEPGDVVLTHKASVGRVAINTVPSVLTPQTTYYRTEQSVLSAEYLALFFESLYFYRQLAAVMSQTTRDFVPISEQYLLSVVLPPPAEQEAIVQHVNDLLRLANSLTKRIEIASRRVERSSQAVLAKAFRGELLNGGVSA